MQVDLLVLLFCARLLPVFAWVLLLLLFLLVWVAGGLHAKASKAGQLDALNRVSYLCCLRFRFLLFFFSLSFAAFAVFSGCAVEGWPHELVRLPDVLERIS